MYKLMLLVSLGVGCGGDGDGNDPPTTDAPPNVPTMRAQVCIVKDLRTPETCETTNAVGLTVELGGATATTAADGTFTIAIPPAGTTAYVVRGSNAVIRTVSTSSRYAATQLSATLPIVPVVDADRFQRTLADSAVALAAGQGAILVKSARIGATVAATPVSAFAPIYSDSEVFLWNGTKIGTTGTALVAGLPAGDADLVYTAPGGTQTADFDVPVLDGAVTILNGR